MISVGDRIEWDSEAHIHTRELKLPNTGRIEQILPKRLKHVGGNVESCAREDAALLFIKIDHSPARIGLCADLPDLRFPDQKDDLDEWEDDLFEEPVRLQFWYSSKKMTVHVTTNEGGVVVETAPIVRKFIGQHANKLARWMKAQGGFKWKKLDGPK